MDAIRPIGAGMNYGTFFAPYNNYQIHCSATECVQYDVSKTSNCKIKTLQYTVKPKHPMDFNRCGSCLKEPK